MTLWKRTKWHPFTGIPLVQRLRVKAFVPRSWFLGYQTGNDDFTLCIIPAVAIQFYWASFHRNVNP